MTWLCGCAKHGCKPKAKRIAKSTTQQCLSEARQFFTTKFRTEAPIPVFQQKEWNKLTRNATSKHRDENRASGKPMVVGAESSEREDREWMAQGRIWSGTPETAEFCDLLNVNHYCSGRVSKVSLATPEGTTVSDVNKDTCRHETLQTDIQRMQDAPLQTIAACTHRDGILVDFNFGLTCVVVVVGCENGYVLPTFLKVALKTNNDESDTSKVSILWTTMFDGTRTKFETLNSRTNEKLTPHCNRKGSNQVLAKHSVCPGLHKSSEGFGEPWTWFDVGLHDRFTRPLPTSWSVHLCA